MEYSAPTIAEIGSIESITLGDLRPGPNQDTFQVWGVEIDDWFGDPSTS